MGYHTCIQCFDGSEQNRKSINGWELLSTLHPRALSYYSDLTLSQAFQLMAAQLSKKAALPMAKILATASCIHWWYVHPCTGIRRPRACMLPYVTWNTMLFYLNHLFTANCIIYKLAQNDTYGPRPLTAYTVFSWVTLGTTLWYIGDQMVVILYMLTTEK